MRAVSLIEPLEDRIAPASLVSISSNGKSATYTDATGDTVVVTTSKGSFTSSQFTFDPNTAGQLTELDLSGSKAFNGANIAFSVFPVNGGSASVNVGYIDALGLRLGNVTLPGDLGRIDVGGASSATALGRLNLQSLGALSTTQGGLDYSSISNITGSVGQIDISGNLDGAIFVQNYTNALGATFQGTGNIGTLTVGGSVDGNSSSGGPGAVLFTGRLSTAVIGGGIEGGPSPFSGSIAGYDSLSGGLGTLSSIGSITVKGSVPDDPNPSPIPGLPGTSILGGSDNLTGGIIAASVGTVNIAGDVFGGAGDASGFIEGALRLGTVKIGGNLIGGNFAAGSPSEADSSGLIFGATVGSVTIGKNIFGGSGIQSGEILSTGSIRQVTVMGDVDGGSAGSTSTAGIAGSIRAHILGSVTIKGSLNGGNFVSGDPNQTGNQDGVIASDTTIGSVTIGKSIVGGTGPSSGEITTLAGSVGSITVAGSVADAAGILGGPGASSGFIQVAGAIGKLALAGNLTGGAGAGSGAISVGGTVSSLVIGGSVTGGTADSTGTISVFGNLAYTDIKGGVTGGDSGTTLLINTGYIQANSIGSMTVAGALTAGIAGTGVLDTSGAIRSVTTIGSLTLGSLVGNATNPAIVSAAGPAFSPNAATDIAIGSITVKGNATYGDILAGYSTDTQNSTVLLGTGVNANAQIGTVDIAGNLTATNIVAGVGTGANGDFGNATSAALIGAGVTDLPSLVSKISRIIIGGSVQAPSATTTGTFGIAAQYIVSASVGGKPLALHPGPDNDTFALNSEQELLGGGNGDLFLYEV